SHLKREAEARGVDSARLIFAPFVPSREDHLSRLAAADLFLDTLPYGAHSTAADAMTVDLPLLTCLGQSFAGRVAASLLGTAGLPDMVAGSLPEYEEKALTLARAPALLVEARARLAKARSTSAHFAPAKIARKLEAAFAAMHRNHM